MKGDRILAINATTIFVATGHSRSICFVLRLGQTLFAIAAISSSPVQPTYKAMSIISINGDTPFPRTESDRAFSSGSNVRAHKARHHGPKKYVCDVLHCGKAFADPDLVRNHEAKHHDETGFVCHICGKEHFNMNGLDIHIREHNGDTPYVCLFPGCSKKFISPFTLHRHSRNHAQFRYEPCGIYFDTAMARDQHNSTCPTYTCSDCEKRGPSDEHESYKAICNHSNLWKNGLKSMTVGDHQIGATTLQEYLEANKV